MRVLLHFGVVAMCMAVAPAAVHAAGDVQEQPASPKPAPAAVSTDGIWTGTSTCMGNRPACKNETVVYRFLPVPEHPDQRRLLGDKIVEGKRLPMGAMLCDYDAASGTLRSEFFIGSYHGEWSFAIRGDDLTGKLLALPAGTQNRAVRAHRVKETEVPPAPPAEDYGDDAPRHP